MLQILQGIFVRLCITSGTLTVRTRYLKYLENLQLNFQKQNPRWSFVKSKVLFSYTSLFFFYLEDLYGFILNHVLSVGCCFLNKLNICVMSLHNNFPSVMWGGNLKLLVFHQSSDSFHPMIDCFILYEYWFLLPMK